MRTPPPEFAELYQHAWPRLLRSAYGITGDRQLAEDAVQVAFAKAYASWSRVRRADDPVAYLRMMAVNAALANARKASNRRERPTDQLPERRVDAGADRVVERQGLWAAVTALPPRQRAVVVLRYYEDLSEAEIAQVLGCAPGTVKSQASAALKTLRSHVEQSVPDRETGESA